MIPLFFVLIIALIIMHWRFFKLKGIPRLFIVFVFLLKIGAGYLSFNYHDAYFAGGDGAIYLKGGHDLIDFSDGNPITFIQLLLNLNKDEPEWKAVYDQIIYWDATAKFNWMNDNRTAIRINALIGLVSRKSAGTHLVLLNFLSLIGLTLWYKVFRNWFKSIDRHALFMAVFLVPGMVFWASGFLKETHAVLFLGLYLFRLLMLLKKPSYLNLLGWILSAFLLAISRSYLTLALIIPTISLLLSRYLPLRFKQKPFVIPMVIGITLSLILVGFSHPLFNLLALKQQQFILIGAQANSYFPLKILTHPFDILLYFPQAMINVYIQPQLFGFSSWLYIFPILQNLDILTVLIVALLFFRKPRRSELNYWIFSLQVWFFGGWLIGLIVPVQGAIDRYKALLLPFLVISILALIDWRRFLLWLIPSNSR